MTDGWRSLLAQGAGLLAEAGVDSPRADAEWLACGVTGVSRGALLLEDPPNDDMVSRYRRWLERRARREPLQHILGNAAFWRGELAVGPGVFVPRPETELLVEWTLRNLSDIAAPLIVDACAGSGAIGHAVASELPKARIVSVEKHDRAYEWLRRNMSGLNAQAVQADITDPESLGDLDGRCDAVVSNPPYVPQETSVSVEAAADPESALFAGRDGLGVIRPLVLRSLRLLKPGGIFVVEHDETHSGQVVELILDAGFHNAHSHEDLAGRPRFATAAKPM